MNHAAVNSGGASCVACGSTALAVYVRTRHFVLNRCGGCDGLTALPRPAPTDLANYHDSEAYFEHPYFQRRRVDVERSDARSRDLLARLRRVRADFDPAGERHLDVGCDTGLFLESFGRLYGTRPVGIDVNARAVALARARGVEAYHTDLEHAADIGEFGLITAIDVIEHVSDPIRMLREIRKRLRPGGLCYVETPNIRALVYLVGRQISNLTGGKPHWLCERLFLPEHVQYFSAAGLRQMAAAAGLRVGELSRRCLGAADVNTTPVVNAGVQSLQLADRVLGREILHCAVLLSEEQPREDRPRR